MKICFWCGEEVKEGEQDSRLQTPSHVDCGLRSIVGSLGHQMKQCSCYGGTVDDPEGVSRREAARMAAEYWRSHQ